MERLLRKLLDAAEKQSVESRFFLLRSLTDIVREASEEWGVACSGMPDGSLLLEWVGHRPWKAVTEEIVGYFANAMEQHRNTGRYSAPVCETVEIIDRDFSHQLTLASIASQLNISEAYLGKIFKKETGHSFNHYLTTVRIEHAKKLLSEDKPIKQVAADCGYIQYTHFLRVFKQT